MAFSAPNRDFHYHIPDAFKLTKMLLFLCLQGASIGVIAGHLVTLWIAFGGLTIDKPPSKILPLTTAGCTNTSFNSHILKPEHRTPVWPTTPTTMSPYLNYTLTTRAAPS